MRFEYVAISGWPPLTWLASCVPSSPGVAVFHGAHVEITPEWFCEAAWAGDYQAGDFDRTDIIVGSGGRIRDGTVVFVSSGSTVDRLHAIRQDAAVWVSNSFPCLLAACGASINAAYPHYFRDVRSIRWGLHRYERFLATSAGPVEFVYFGDLVWDGTSLTARPKDFVKRDFSTFDRYVRFLESSLRRVVENVQDHRRRHRYDLLATASTGYDSTAVTTLARRAGCCDVLSFEVARYGERDSGAPIARMLGARPIVVSTDAWRLRSLPEVPFFAGSARGEDLPFAGAEEHLASRLLLTGNAGDTAWAKSPPDPGEHLVRRSTGGLSLTEYRLRVGFLHCAPAYWGARQIRDIAALSNSPELARWDVRDHYSRPICRRIVEEAGVPRDAFGTDKRFVTVSAYRDLDFMTDAAWNDYRAWLSDHWREWTREWRLPPVAYLAIDGPLYASGALVGRAARRIGRTGIDIDWLARFRPVFRRWRFKDLPTQPRWARRYLFPWAVERSMERYQRPMTTND